MNSEVRKWRIFRNHSIGSNIWSYLIELFSTRSLTVHLKIPLFHEILCVLDFILFFKIRMMMQGHAKSSE